MNLKNLDAVNYDLKGAATGCEVFMNTIGASPEVAREMLIASRNRHIADLMNDSLFERELKSFRFSLIEQRKHLLFAYGSTTSNDIRKIILVLLNSADAFLQLLTFESGPLAEVPCNTVEEKMGIITGVAFVPGKENTGRYGINSPYIMKYDFSRDSSKEIIKGDSSINTTATG
jgi:hypothetical protein